MSNFEHLIYGTPICIATKSGQRRKHRKKRINKKWLKKYGCYEYNMMPHGQVITVDGVIYMTKQTYETLFTEREDK